MTAHLISVSQCVAFSGLAADELILGVTPSKLHDRLYQSYLRNRSRTGEALPSRIVRDIRKCVALGATKAAADLLIVLRKALSAHMARSLPAQAASRSAERSRSRARSKRNGVARPAKSADVLSVTPPQEASPAAWANVFSLDAYRLTV